MENSDLTAIVKELMAIFTPKKEESSESKKQTEAQSEKKGGGLPAQHTPLYTEKQKNEKFSDVEKEGKPQFECPPRSLSSPEVRYREFLLRHEAQKRKLQKAPSKPKQKKPQAAHNKFLSLPLFPEDDFPPPK